MEQNILANHQYFYLTYCRIQNPNDDTSQAKHLEDKDLETQTSKHIQNGRKCYFFLGLPSHSYSIFRHMVRHMAVGERIKYFSKPYPISLIFKEFSTFWACQTSIYLGFHNKRADVLKATCTRWDATDFLVWNLLSSVLFSKIFGTKTVLDNMSGFRWKETQSYWFSWNSQSFNIINSADNIFFKRSQIFLNTWPRWVNSPNGHLKGLFRINALYSNLLAFPELFSGTTENSWVWELKVLLNRK